MGRKKLGIWIPDEDIWKKFVSKVAEIHGQTYGKTGEELEEAILLWLEKHENVSEGGTPLRENTRTHEEKKEKKPRGKHKAENKDVMYGRIQTTKGEQRLEEIGKMLLGAADLINKKGLEKFIVSQKVSDINFR